MTSKLNAILAWMLAFGLAFVPIAFVLSRVIDLYAPVSIADWTTGMVFGTWAVPSLLITAIVVRPVENFIRRHGYGLPPVETARGLGGDEDSGDAISSAAERALTEAVERELGTRVTKRPDS